MNIGPYAPLPSRLLALTIAVSAITGITITPLPSEAAPKAKRTEMRDVVTHRELSARRQADKTTDPIASSFEPAEASDPAKVNPPQDIVSNSDFLSSGGSVTLIPKRALLHVPDRLKDRTQIRDNMQIVTWPSFHTRNRSWITTVEVSRLQAEGNTPLDEKKMEQLMKTGDILIATMGGAPISVLPLKVPDENAGEEEGADETDESSTSEIVK